MDFKMNLLAYCLALFALIVPSECTDNARLNSDCPICGNYDLESGAQDKEYAEVLTEMGYKDDSRKAIQGVKHGQLDISKSGSLYTIILSGDGEPETKNEFEMDKEFLMKLCDGREIPTIVTQVIEAHSGRIEVLFAMTFDGFTGRIKAQIKFHSMYLHFNVNGKTAMLRYREGPRK